MKARMAAVVLTGVLVCALPALAEAGSKRGSRGHDSGRGQRPPATYYRGSAGRGAPSHAYRAPVRQGGYYYGDRHAYRPGYRPHYAPAYRPYYRTAYRPYYYRPYWSYYPAPYFYYDDAYAYPAYGYPYSYAPYPYYAARPGFHVGIGFYFRW